MITKLHAADQAAEKAFLSKLKERLGGAAQSVRHHPDKQTDEERLLGAEYEKALHAWLESLRGAENIS